MRTLQDRRLLGARLAGVVLIGIVATAGCSPQSSGDVANPAPSSAVGGSDEETTPDESSDLSTYDAFAGLEGAWSIRTTALLENGEWDYDPSEQPGSAVIAREGGAVTVQGVSSTGTSDTWEVGTLAGAPMLSFPGYGTPCVLTRESANRLRSDCTNGHGRAWVDEWSKS